MSSLKVSGLRKSFGQFHVLDGLSLEVAAGDILALLGRSGSGKSTLLRILALLEPADAGDAWIGEDHYLAGGAVTMEPVKLRRRVGMVFQNHNLLPNLTVLANCTLGPIRSGRVSRAQAESEAEQLLITLGVAGLSKRYPNSLSGGQAQRVAIARALMMKPDILLLDEITSALDPESVAIVLESLERINTIGGVSKTAMIVVTHILSFAEAFATNIAVLDAGRIIETLPAGRFAQDANSNVARSFIAGRSARWTPKS